MDVAIQMLIGAVWQTGSAICRKGCYMYTIFICDDEQKILSDITRKVTAVLPDAAVSGFSDGNVLLEAVTDKRCDILLLDIDMPEISGLDIAKRLTVMPQKPLLIFVTGHDELVYDSLQFHPFGFVRKSYMDRELPGILADCVEELRSHEKHFCFYTAGAGIKLPLEEILYFEAEGNYLRLIAKDGEYRFRSTLSSVENALSGGGFVRIHKGFLVNQAAVKILSADEAELTSGTKLPIGRSYAELAKKRIMRYMIG